MRRTRPKRGGSGLASVYAAPPVGDANEPPARAGCQAPQALLITAIVSKQATVSGENSPAAAPPPGSSPGESSGSSLDEPGRAIVEEELSILERIRARMAKDQSTEAHQFEDLNSSMIELRDEIA